MKKFDKKMPKKEEKLHKKIGAQKEIDPGPLGP